MECKHGRHTEAFMLLFLSEEEAYGGRLLQRFQEELPFNPCDSAIVYRTLKKLEQEGAVGTDIRVNEADQPVKVYRITEKGLRYLDAFYEDICLRYRNFAFFIDKYKERNPSK